MPVDEIKYYGSDGSVYPWDIQHNPTDPAFCEIHPDASISLRIHTEPGFAEANLIFNDGEAKSVPLTLWSKTDRYEYWKCTFAPENPQIHYGFALKRTDSTIVYFGSSGVISLLVFFFKLDLNTKKPFITPDWMTGAFVYQIFPERFANGDPTLNLPGTVPWGTAPQSRQFQGGDLIGIKEKVDYLQELGVDLVYLNPIFTSPSNHKYDTTDYYNVDPAFGGNQALRELVNVLHMRDIRLILDASFNHCHPGFFAFQDILKFGPDSKYWNWFSLFEYPVKIRVRKQKLPDWVKNQRENWFAWLQDFEQQYNIPFDYIDDNAGPGIEPSYQAWMNTITMPKINLSNPETKAYFLDVASYWLREFDVDGWRMDVVPWVVDDFWIDFRDTVKTVKPGAFLLSEVWGDVSTWLMGDRFDATMNYTFRSLVIDYFGTEVLDTGSFVDRCKQMLLMYPSNVNGVNQNLISSHDTPRFLHVAGGDLARLRLVTLFQFTMPGAPGVYYGDEIGMSGAQDPDCRRAFPWNDKDTWDLRMLELVKSLARLRKEMPALRYGDWQAVWSGPEALAYIREHGAQRILIIIARSKLLEHQWLPVAHSFPKLLWGDGEWEAKTGGIWINKLSSWSGIVIHL